MKPARQIVDGVLLLNKPVGITSNAALKKPSGCSTPKRRDTPAPSTPSPTACCRCVSVKPPSFPPTCSTPTSAIAPCCNSASPPRPAIRKARCSTRVRWRSAATTLPRCCRASWARSSRSRPCTRRSSIRGRLLYEYARAGIEIERPPRKVTIRALEIVECAPPRVVLDVQCTAGTYIRTLAQDIGAALGCGAHLTALTRTAAGGFSLDQAHALTDLDALDASQRHALLLPADCLVMHLPAVQLDAAGALSLCQDAASCTRTRVRGSCACMRRRTPSSASPTPTMASWCRDV